MTQEQIKRGNELLKEIGDFKNKIEAAKIGLDFPNNCSIKIHFYTYSPYELDTVLKEEVIQQFLEHYKILLAKAEKEFNDL